MYFLISSFLNGVLPFCDGFHRHETFLTLLESICFILVGFLSVNLEDSLEVVCRWEEPRLFVRRIDFSEC